jgi:aminopeptidase-like protein
METRAMNNEESLGLKMHQLMAKAFPICRSITGDGVRETLRIISDVIPLTIHEVPTGTAAFDWSVPKEWNIRDAYVADKSGKKVVDFKQHNLHVIGYSVPVDKWITLSELQEHLHSLPEQPNAIPYVTSYYKERWGFCISHNERAKLIDGKYHVYIDSTLKEGSLTYGECLLKGETEQEVFLSTYVCHPSMANNELSGPVVTAFIVKWLASQPRKYTYRVIFIPETIGSITYLSRNLGIMKKNVKAGFNISCIGDNRAYSYVASRYENTLADKVVSNVLSFNHPDFIKYSFLDRGSDERQYCSPGVDLPLVTLSRSKYGTYPEYHTSLDNLDVVTEEGLLGGYELVKDCINVIENNRVFRVTCYGEPQLGKRGLYPNLSTKKSGASVETMMDFIAYADGNNDLLKISKIIHKPVWEIVPIAEKLLEAGLLEEIRE